MKLKLLDGATATNSPPTAGSATVGFKLSGMGGWTSSSPANSQNVPTSGQCALIVKSTAGSGTMTVTLKLWVYSAAVSEWLPYGTNATDANRGLLNEGNAIGEVNSDTLTHAELVNGLQNFERVYLEITSIGGTATAVDAYLVGR